MPIEMDKEWLALRFDDKIQARGNTKAQARRAAEELGKEYQEIVAVPKGGSYGFY